MLRAVDLRISRLLKKVFDVEVCYQVDKEGGSTN
jgi:hypothetical protein